jgi:hypothetical protein
LAPSELSALAGAYYSDELDATYELTVSGSNLLVRRPRAPVDTLRPTDQLTVRGAGYTLRFAAIAPGSRESPSFTFNNDRARGIVFVRRPSR